MPSHAVTLWSVLGISESLTWLRGLWRAITVYSACLTPQGFAGLSLSVFRKESLWMGLSSFHFVTFAAAFIAIALTIQCVQELRHYQAEDLSGAVIAIGLLREIGPLTVSTAWCTAVSGRLVQEGLQEAGVARGGCLSELRDYIFTRYLTALLMACALGSYGLAIGFLTGGFAGFAIGLNSMDDFFESARQAIEVKDILIYFVKLNFINPTIGVFCAAQILRGVQLGQVEQNYAATRAVAATMLVIFIVNSLITFAFYTTRS